MFLKIETCTHGTQLLFCIILPFMIVQFCSEDDTFLINNKCLSYFASDDHNRKPFLKWFDDHNDGDLHAETDDIVLLGRAA